MHQLDGQSFYDYSLVKCATKRQRNVELLYLKYSTKWNKELNVDYENDEHIFYFIDFIYPKSSQLMKNFELIRFPVSDS